MQRRSGHFLSFFYKNHTLEKKLIRLLVTKNKDYTMKRACITVGIALAYSLIAMSMEDDKEEKFSLVRSSNYTLFCKFASNDEFAEKIEKVNGDDAWEIRSLQVHSSEITRVPDLANFICLKNIDFSFTNIRSLEWVYTTPYLKMLNINHTKVVDINPLAYLPDFERLYANHTQVDDPAVLIPIAKKLTSLELNYNPVWLCKLDALILYFKNLKITEYRAHIIDELLGAKETAIEQARQLEKEDSNASNGMAYEIKLLKQEILSYRQLAKRLRAERLKQWDALLFKKELYQLTMQRRDK
jgi:hypothetical protein